MQSLMETVADYMGVASAKLELGFYREDQPVLQDVVGGSASLQRSADELRHRVWLDEAVLHDPLQVVASLAREVANVILVGTDLVCIDNEDEAAEFENERIAELLTVFLGMGVITANSALVDANWNNGTHEGWSIGRRGFLSLREYGYALSHYAWVRGESIPSWSSHLRPDVRSACKQGLRFLVSHETNVAQRA